MEKTTTAKFEITIPKTAKTQTKFVGKDYLHPNMKYVCIEPGRGFMAATDAIKLQTIKIEAAGEYPESCRILVEPEHVAKLAGKTVLVTVSEADKNIFIELDAQGEKYTTTHTCHRRYPDVMRVIPDKEKMNAIKLTPESLDALNTICKLHKSAQYLSVSTIEGDTRAIVCYLDKYTSTRAAYSLELAEPACVTVTLGLNPRHLVDCLKGCNGAICVDNDSRPIFFDGEAEATILIPCRTSIADTDYIEEVRNNSVLVSSNFVEDAKAIVARLRDAAAELWQSICKTNYLIPGNYTAKNIESRYKAKCGQYVIPEYSTTNLHIGNIMQTVESRELFATLAVWESATKSPKMVFNVGNVVEVTATVLEATGEGATEKKMKLRKLGGNWYCEAKRRAKDFDTNVYYQLDGIIFFVIRRPWGTIDDAEKWQKWSSSVEGEIESRLHSCASSGDKYYTEVLNSIEARRATETAIKPTGVAIKQGYTISETYGKFEAVDGRILVGRKDEFRSTHENGVHGYFTGKILYEVNNQTGLFLTCHKHGGEEKSISFIKEKIKDFATAVEILDKLAETDKGILPIPQICRDAVIDYKKSQTELQSEISKEEKYYAEAEKVLSESTKAQERPSNTLAEYNVNYFLQRYGNVQNLHKVYTEAIAAKCQAKIEYDNNPRKGGKYRRKRIDELRRAIDALVTEYHEIRAIFEAREKGCRQSTIKLPKDRKLAPYFARAAKTIKHTTPTRKIAQRAKFRAKTASMNMAEVSPAKLHRNSTASGYVNPANPPPIGRPSRTSSTGNL